jgi:Domain of unknown function (DUF1707)/Domain of unknown function (DUF4190)
MAMSPGYGMMPAGDGRLRASTADRERAVDVLKAGFAEGRLTKDEYDERVTQAYTARTYADLSMVTGDLPGGQMVAPYGAPYLPPYMPVARRTNGLAVASLVCGLAQPFMFGLTTIPAVILGHMAQSQIRRSGEDGKGLATAGLVLGWIGLSIGLLVAVVIIAAASHGYSATQSGSGGP